jgi:hypothetical protein
LLDNVNLDNIPDIEIPNPRQVIDPTHPC